MEHPGRYIPNRLRRYRLIKGYTKGKVAQKLNLKKVNQIVSWENGTTSPSLLNLIRLYVLYDVLIEDMYFDLIMYVRAELADNPPHE